jgi:hypothetical protein
VSCTATVSDADAGPGSAPAGDVAFESDGAGSFDQASCSPVASGDTATCSVSYTPTGIGSAPHAITARLTRDEEHEASSGTELLTVTPRSTATAVSCAPSAPEAGAVVSCTTTVSDTASGSASAPTGEVTFAQGSCMLVGSGETASCSVSYTPSRAGAETLEASYAGDEAHAPSSGTTEVAATAKPVPEQPAPAPAAPAPPAKEKLPCLSSRRFTVNLLRGKPKTPKGLRVRGDLRGLRITRALVLDERGRTMRRPRFKRSSVGLDLRRLPAGTYALRVTVKLRSGKTVTAQRAYRTCTGGTD